MSRVLLVNMPFSSLRWPAIGISLLKAGLEDRGIACDVAYNNFDFAEAIGIARYEWVNDNFGFVLGGDRIFAKQLFGQSLSADEDYCRNILRSADPDFNQDNWHEYVGVDSFVEPFLDRVLAQVDWGHYPEPPPLLLPPPSWTTSPSLLEHAPECRILHLTNRRPHVKM